jgi:hypothetical protein
MAIIGNEILDYVKTQITKRQEVYGSGVSKNRTPQQIQYLNTNTSWIKLASGVYVNKDSIGNSLAKNNILFNGTSTFNGSSLVQKGGRGQTYVDSEFGPTPMAGIISADIKALNRGSLKKSTVKIKAHNKEQFDAIDVLYMRIGYTVMLEWGNSFYLDGDGNVQEIQNTLIEDLFFSFSSDGDYTAILPYIENKRKTYWGNYDALLGRISNFDWAFNPDGSYDITLTILSLGDIIESLKTNTSIDNKTSKFLKEARKNNQSIAGNSAILEKNKDDNAITSMLWLWTYFNPPPQPAVPTPTEEGGTPSPSGTKPTISSGQTKINELEIFKYLKSKNLNKIQVAAVLGNMFEESQFNPGAFNPKDYGGTTDLGLIQWNSINSPGNPGQTNLTRSKQMLEDLVGSTVAEQLNTLFNGISKSSMNRWINDPLSKTNVDDSTWKFAAIVEVCHECNKGKATYESSYQFKRTKSARDFLNRFANPTDQLYWP